jgi:hypothetical protein
LSSLSIENYDSFEVQQKLILHKTKENKSEDKKTIKYKGGTREGKKCD